MAETPVMNLEVCPEKDKSLIVHRGLLTLESRKRKCNVKKTILISKEPEEKATLEFILDFSFEPTYGDVKEIILGYDFLLTFQNYLHVVSKDYGYEIDFYVCTHDNGLSEHSLLFSSRVMRETNSILEHFFFDNNSDQAHPQIVHKLIIDNDKNHMCCRIRRFNVKNAEVNQLSSPQTNVGAMLHQTEHYSDVTLVVGDKLFKVHKHILSCVSNVFKTYFSRASQKDNVIIEDCHPEIVKDMLLFIYTGKSLLLSTRPIELFRLAAKFEIQSLMDRCLENFLFILSSDNVVDMLYTAKTYKLTDLKANLVKFIQVNEKEMVQKDNYRRYLCRDLKLHTVVHILKLCDKYKEVLGGVENEAFNFVKINNEFLVSDQEFLKLFQTHPSLMQRLYIFIHNKSLPIKSSPRRRDG